MALLNTGVAKRNIYYWKKPIRFISYLNQTVGGVGIIRGFNIIDLFTWVDGSYDLHKKLSSKKEENFKGLWNASFPIQ